MVNEPSPAVTHTKGAMKTFRYTKCGCTVTGRTFLTRCPKHDNPIDLRPVNTGGRPKVTDETNKAQGRYGNYLNLQKIAGEILDYKLNAIRLKIGEQKGKGKRDAWWKGDWAVLQLNGRIRLDEFKGHWEIAAKVRIKSAALQFREWFDFRAVYEEGDMIYRYEDF